MATARISNNPYEFIDCDTGTDVDKSSYNTEPYSLLLQSSKCG